jgi:hypothetical protein
MIRSNRPGWLAGFVVGVAAGVATLEFPTLGWLLAVAFAVPAVIVGPRAAAIGGLLSGLGGVWLVLLGRSHSPGIEPWLAVGAAMFGAGLLLSALAAWRARPS